MHPTRGADERWGTDVDLTPGSWRIFADFTPTGHEGLTLGADVIVPGRVTPVPSRRSSTTTVDGYTVTLAGDLDAETSSDLNLSVTRDGEHITDLEPYLGAYGHLVALRAGDLVIASSAAPTDGATRTYTRGEPYAPAPDFGLTHSLYHAAEAAGITVRVGPVASVDVFYNPDADYAQRWRDRGVLAFEMEASALFYLAARSRVRAACALVVSDVLSEEETSEKTYLAPEDLARAVDPAIADAIISKYPEVGAERQDIRQYPGGSLAANIVGGIDWDGHGLLGLEDSLDSKLAGTDGSVTYDRGSDGVVIPGSYRNRHDAVNGSTVQLTLDGDRLTLWAAPDDEEEVAGTELLRYEAVVPR